MISIVSSEKIKDKEKKQFTEEEKDKIKNYKKFTGKFNTLNILDYKDFGKIKIIYADADNNELKIITSATQFNEFKK